MALLVGALVSAQDAKKDETKKDVAAGPATDDAKLLQGDWKAVSVEDSGEKVPEDQVGKLKLTFKDDQLSAHFASTYKLDTTKSPRTIDVTPSAGPEKDKTLEGIYEFKGDDLKICVAKPGNPRPKEFATMAGSGTILLVLKKAK
jgi:uncharacterized protein (TIGR03067 family)